MSPKAPGKNYYEQVPPSQRGYKSRGMLLHQEHAKLFDEDAKASGGKAAYLRKLWEEDRRRRGLPDLPELQGHKVSEQQEPS